MTLGIRIKAARERLHPKMTQKQLGAIFGISDKAVSGWERDDTIPELKKLPVLARRLKVPLAWLLAGEGHPPASNNLEARIESLTPDERTAVDAVIETFEKRRGRVA